MTHMDDVLARTLGVDRKIWEDVWGFFGFEPTGDPAHDTAAMFGALAQKAVEQHNDIVYLRRRVAVLEAGVGAPQ